jgi:hypothetical protein
MDDCARRDKAATEFWREYVRAARDGYGLEFYSSNTMRVAINEWFTKIDHAAADARAAECLIFRCSIPQGKNRQELRLIFSNGKDRTLRRTLKIDARFQHGGRFDHHDFMALKIAVQSMLVSEGEARPKTVG